MADEYDPDHLVRTRCTLLTTQERVIDKYYKSNYNSAKVALQKQEEPMNLADWTLRPSVSQPDSDSA